jgi:methyl-accepting chemotaxis protein
MLRDPAYAIAIRPTSVSIEFTRTKFNRKRNSDMPNKVATQSLQAANSAAGRPNVSKATSRNSRQERPSHDQSRLLALEMTRIAEACGRGSLSGRVDADLFSEGFREIAQSANAMIDSLTEPLALSAEYVERIGRGDIPPRITEGYVGDFGRIRNGLNGIIDSLAGIMAEMNSMSDEHNKGDIDVVLAADKYEGAYRTMAQGVNDMVAGHIAVKKKALACIAEFGKGNFDAPLEKFPGKKAFINEIVERVRTNIQFFIAQMQYMSDEHNKGDIDVRIPAEKFEGAYRTMADGVNEMVAGHIAVKKKAMACVAEFSKGNFHAPLEKFPGKKAFINEIVERLRTNIQFFISEMQHMAEEHNRGDIDVVIPAEKFEGAYRTMADGINEMVAGHIAVKKKAMACVAEFGEGNFNAPLEQFPGKKAFINTTIEQVRSNLKAVISDMVTLSEAAVEGKLSVRADANNHRGDYRRIVQGVNDTLEAVVDPLNVAARYVERISKGDIPDRSQTRMLETSTGSRIALTL